MSQATRSLIPDEDPVPLEVRAVIELFASQLAAVSFPDVDVVSLRREVEELHTEATLVTRAREALEAAAASLEQRRGALRSSAARAIAYAKIYSEAHPDRVPLASALAGLTHPPATTAPAKRRGRPPRRSADLFDATTLPPSIAEVDSSGPSTSHTERRTPIAT